MKKSVLTYFMAALLMMFGLNMANAQEQPSPKKDTVNMDTEAKPEFYFEVEDENNDPGKSSSSTLYIIIGAVVVVGAAAYFLLKKKK